MHSVHIIVWISLSVQIATGLISWDTGCGSSKGCFPRCESGCEYLVTWTASVSSVAFTVKVEESDTSAYLGIGFSHDLRMGEDSVVGCIVPNSAVESWYNEGTHSHALSPTSTGLSGTSVSVTNGVVTCTFTRAYTHSNGQFFDLNDDYRLMLLVGEAELEDGTYALGHHYMIPWTSDGKVDFNSHNIVDLYKLNSPLVKLHGIMMMLAWMLCSTIGIVIARYNKQLVPEKELFGAKYWFQLHRGSMIGTVVFAVIGFISIFVEIAGYCQLTPPSSKAVTNVHPVSGIIVTILMIANPIMAVFRPSAEHKLRWLFNWGHFGVGVGAIVFAVFTLQVGLVTERAMLPTAALIVGLVWLGVAVILAVILEVYKWKQANQKDVAVANGGQPDTNGMSIEEKADSSKTLTTPLILLLVFIGVMAAFSIALLAIISAS